MAFHNQKEHFNQTTLNLTGSLNLYRRPVVINTEEGYILNQPLWAESDLEISSRGVR